ncbi:MAG: flagellin [Alphaproteobacteria bacterium]|nr:flagellin [Alphaproteobacteria bacterium]
MVVSINTNAGTMSALQALNRTSKDLAASQMRITTGLKVNGPKDNAATFAIVQNMRGDIAGIGAVKNALALGESTVDVAIDGATAVSDLLVEMKSKAVDASQSGLAGASQTALHEEFTALRNQITTVVAGVDFNGKNLIESGASNLSVLSSVESSTIVVMAQPIDTTTLGIHTATLSNSSNATTAVTLISQAIVEVSSALTALGTSSRGLEIQHEFTSKLVDVLKESVGTLVDADLAAEVEALQIKEQLGVAGLSIANGRPRAILGLFSGD